MTDERNKYGLPVVNHAVSKLIPMTLCEATATRAACIKVLLGSPPSAFWNDLHGAYMSVCITFGLPTRIPK